MRYEKTIIRNLSRVEARKLGLALLAGCCLVILTYFISMSENRVDQQPTETYRISSNGAEAAARISLQKQERGKKTQDLSKINKSTPVTRINTEEERTESTKPERGKKTQDLSKINKSTPVTRINTEEERTESTKPEAESTHHSPKKEPQKIQMITRRSEPICDVLNPRTEFCDLKGDVRVHGKSSSVSLFSPDHSNLQWNITPYVRKQMQNIPKVTVTATPSAASLPECTADAQSAVPAIVFALGGFTGNYYHDFTDVLLPLFLTAREFDGEVQFLVTNIQPWWLLKYRPIVERLSRYEPVDLDRAEGVLCRSHVMVGLRFHNDLVIEPARAPNGYTMRDFTAFLRGAYSLPRDRAVSLREAPGTKPRLLVVARNGTRRFANVPEIVAAAEGAGFEVVRADARFGDVARFVSVVNSCDVIMGVHGAGLTNFVFMPANAVMIQIVPCCELQGMADHTFRQPAVDAGLRYLEYEIAVEESTLVEAYPREHPVFTNPQWLHRQGFYEMAKVYLGQQNVRLDVSRFRPFLLRAMELLRQ